MILAASARRTPHGASRLNNGEARTFGALCLIHSGSGWGSGPPGQWRGSGCSRPASLSLAAGSGMEP